MTTARDLVTQSLRDAGVVGLGITPSAEDINNGLTRLNQMIYQWRRSRWLIFCDEVIEFNCDGSESYTIGPGGDIDTTPDPRPDRLEDGCRVVQISPGPPNQVGWPLQLVQSYEAYQKIRLQEMQSFPTYVFYKTDYPLGEIRPWPVPSSLYKIELLVKRVLQSFANLSTDVNLPLEYETAIQYNLQLRARMAYRLRPDPFLNKLANATLQAIKNANTQVPTLLMPAALARDGLYNVFSDNSV